MKFSSIVIALVAVAPRGVDADANGVLARRRTRTKSKKSDYEIWASDQSNSVTGQDKLGVKGSFLWIFDSNAVQGQLENGIDAVSLPCVPGATEGPCDVLNIFPMELMQHDADGATDKTLGMLEGFGRLHGVIKDPLNRYVNANFFAPGGGYNGIIDTETKEAVALFRLTKFNRKNSASDGTISEGRSVHMSSWSADGSAIIFANLHGKAVERVNVGRDSDGTITSLEFDRSATLGLGSSMEVAEEATFFRGENAFGKQLIGSISDANYELANLENLTPNGLCKEDACDANSSHDTGRKNNVPVCPIPSLADNLYITFGGGGLLIADLKSTPMAIVGEYGSNVVNGAGCGGIQVGEQMFIDSGVSAGSSGFDHSTFSLYSFDDTAYQQRNPPNTPLPIRVFKDESNTCTLGNVDCAERTSNESGQIPGQTTRRDAHGAWVTKNGKYVHVADRIQNVVETFHTETYKRSTYDLVSIDGKSGRAGAAGACWSRSVTDDYRLPLNDPTPDLMEITPDGKYFVIALRGPAPVTVGHSSQGSCPGVGIVEITEDGEAGRLADVLRTTNVVEDNVTPAPQGGVNYSGAERSDVHAVIVVSKYF